MTEDSSIRQFYKYVAQKPYEWDLAKQMILDGDIKPNENYQVPMSPLSLVVEQGLYDLCELLLEMGADPNFGGRSGKFPLYMASQLKGDVGDKILKLLIGKGADINIKYQTGNNAFLQAVKQQDLSKVKILLECGADVNVCNNSGDSALCVAAIHGNMTMAKELLNAGSKIHLDQSNNKWRKLTSGVSPLHYTAYGPGGGHPAMASLLLKYGADVDVKLPENGRTPLHLCAIRDATLTAKVLISHGCQINPVSTDNNELKTPLHKAIDNDKLGMVLELINAGADLNITCQHNMTPLMLALGCQIRNKRQIVFALLRAGCDVNSITGFVSHFCVALEADVKEQMTASEKDKLPYSAMLIMAGCVLNEYEKEKAKQLFKMLSVKYNYLHEVIDNPDKLQHICRLNIRKHLHDNIEYKIHSLHLPQKLKDFVNLDDIAQ